MNNSSSILNAARTEAKSHHKQYDSSHDYLHVQRVTLQSLLIAKSLIKEGTVIDLLVVELSALFHDLIDSKYLPLVNGVKQNMTAHERLKLFWSNWTIEDINQERRRLVERIVDNVSYSKEVKRIQKGEVTEWHLSCRELHCVQDADKLDAIGAFGILRCAAYSGATGVSLFIPPSSSSAVTPLLESTPKEESTSNKSTAIDHFEEKLINLQSMMKTEKGRSLAKSRTEFLYTFMEQVNSEWKEIEGEE